MKTGQLSLATESPNPSQIAFDVNLKAAPPEIRQHGKHNDSSKINKIDVIEIETN